MEIIEQRSGGQGSIYKREVDERNLKPTLPVPLRLKPRVDVTLPFEERIGLAQFQSDQVISQVHPILICGPTASSSRHRAWMCQVGRVNTFADGLSLSTGHSRQGTVQQRRIKEQVAKGKMAPEDAEKPPEEEMPIMKLVAYGLVILFVGYLISNGNKQ